MRQAARWAAVAVAVEVGGCAPTWSQGYADGCDDGAADGYAWGSEDAEGCYTPNDVPPPGDAGGSDYGEGYDAGYEACYPEAYRDGYADTVAYLGAC